MVIAIKAASDDAARLKTLGVCVGRKVELVKPGDPLILRVLGSRLGLSARLAAQVIVSGSCPDPRCQQSPGTAVPGLGSNP
jgi:Fe2+ transport system protein FeoA